MIHTIGLYDVKYPKKIIEKTTEIFPVQKRMEVSDKQVKNLIEKYKAKIHYTCKGDIESNLDNTILQITGQSFNGPEIGKIILGNLKKYRIFFENFDLTIGSFSKEQLKFYNSLIIEVPAKAQKILEQGFLNNGYYLLANEESIKELLSLFIPANDDYKFKNLKLQKDGSYIRHGGLKGEIEMNKKMYIKYN